MLDFYRIPNEVTQQADIVGFYCDTENGQVEEISEEKFIQSLYEVDHFLEYSEKVDQNMSMLKYAEETESPGLSAARCFTPWFSYEKIV